MGDYTCEITTSNHHHFKTSMQAVEFHHRITCFSHHQNSHSSWSLMCRNQTEEVVAHYRCKVWGLQRSLGSYVSSFIAARLEAKKKYRVLAYTDIGLILLYVTTYPADQTYFVANLISKQRITIPTPPTSLLGFETEEPWFLQKILHTSGGSLMYMNIFSESVHHKLVVWRLMNREWQLVSVLMGFDYLPLTLAINPFDGNTIVHVESDARFFGIY
uniref:F-box protein At3g26010-like beta-propeller domain-containing protein n=1 Tax=Brassica campestris TaxID=3711 RepID=A0A3P6ADY0_BRACM|nr:unnamed protein product [Brassica rapa]